MHIRVTVRKVHKKCMSSLFSQAQVVRSIYVYSSLTIGVYAALEFNSPLHAPHVFLHLHSSLTSAFLRLPVHVNCQFVVYACTLFTLTRYSYFLVSLLLDAFVYLVPYIHCLHTLLALAQVTLLLCPKFNFTYRKKL